MFGNIVARAKDARCELLKRQRGRGELQKPAATLPEPVTPLRVFAVSPAIAASPPSGEPSRWEPRLSHYAAPRSSVSTARQTSLPLARFSSVFALWVNAAPTISRANSRTSDAFRHPAGSAPLPHQKSVRTGTVASNDNLADNVLSSTSSGSVEVAGASELQEAAAWPVSDELTRGDAVGFSAGGTVTDDRVRHSGYTPAIIRLAAPTGLYWPAVLQHHCPYQRLSIGPGGPSVNRLSGLLPIDESICRYSTSSNTELIPQPARYDRRRITHPD